MVNMQSLMAAGDALMDRMKPNFGISDWRALYAETPDDTLPGEDDEPVAAPDDAAITAADSTAAPSLTVEQLSGAVLEGLTGVAEEWLAPVRPVFERLAALAMSKHVTDEDFIAALEKAQREMPEIFELLDTRALEDAFMNATGAAALAGSVRRYEP